MKNRAEKVALAATSTALGEAVDAVKHFTLRARSPESRSLMAAMLAHRISRLSHLREQLLAQPPATTHAK